MQKKLPPDWGIDAMAAEARKRGVSYGQLEASTTLYERDQIRENYRKHYGEKKSRTCQKDRDPKHLDLCRQVQEYKKKLDE